MPIYEYSCDRCGNVEAHLWRSTDDDKALVCKVCHGSELTKLVSSFAVHRSLTSRLSSLDPKYDKMVNQAVAGTPEADPNRHLQKMKPFSSTGKKGK